MCSASKIACVNINAILFESVFGSLKKRAVFVVLHGAFRVAELSLLFLPARLQRRDDIQIFQRRRVTFHGTAGHDFLQKPAHDFS